MGLGLDGLGTDTATAVQLGGVTHTKEPRLALDVGLSRNVSITARLA
jgi:hypothetical protein